MIGWGSVTGAVLLPTVLALTLSTVVAAAILGALPGLRRGRSPRGVASLTALVVTVAGVAAFAATAPERRDRLGEPSPAAPTTAGPTQPKDRVVPTATPVVPGSSTVGAPPPRQLRSQPVRRTTRVVAAAPVVRRPVAPAPAARPAAAAPPATAAKAPVTAPAPVEGARAPDGVDHPVVGEAAVAPRAQSAPAPADDDTSKASPAEPAVPAEPADPNGPGESATPATPATPASPAEPDRESGAHDDQASPAHAPHERGSKDC